MMASTAYLLKEADLWNFVRKFLSLTLIWYFIKIILAPSSSKHIYFLSDQFISAFLIVISAFHSSLRLSTNRSTWVSSSSVVVTNLEFGFWEATSLVNQLAIGAKGFFIRLTVDEITEIEEGSLRRLRSLLLRGWVCFNRPSWFHDSS